MVTNPSDTSLLRRMRLNRRHIRKRTKELVMIGAYQLADRADVALPRLLQRDYGLRVLGKMKRDYAFVQ